VSPGGYVWDDWPHDSIRDGADMIDDITETYESSMWISKRQ